MVSCCVDVETAKPKTETPILVAKEIGGFLETILVDLKKRICIGFRSIIMESA